MNIDARKTCFSLLLLSAAITLSFASGCQSRKKGSSLSDATSVNVHVLLEGPWVIVQDTDASNPGGYLAIAPFMSDHTALYVQAKYGVTLGTGQYRLLLNNNNQPTGPNFRSYSPNVTQAVIRSATLNQNGYRYAFHFPPPTTIVEETSGTSQITDAGGVHPASETGLVISLEYQVDPNSTIAVDGAPSADPITAANPGPPQDTTPKLPYSIALGNPALIRIGSEPSQQDLNPCSLQSQKTFQALMSMLNLSATITYSPCSSTSMLADLTNIRRLLRSVHSGESLKDIDRLQSIFDGTTKSPTQQGDVIDLLEKIRKVLSGLQPSPDVTAAVDQVHMIEKAMNVPHKDCKTPIVAPVVN